MIQYILLDVWTIIIPLIAIFLVIYGIILFVYQHADKNTLERKFESESDKKERKDFIKKLTIIYILVILAIVFIIDGVKNYLLHV